MQLGGKINFHGWDDAAAYTPAAAAFTLAAAAYTPANASYMRTVRIRLTQSS